MYISKSQAQCFYCTYQSTPFTKTFNFPSTTTVTRSTSATTIRKPTPPREVPDQFGQEEGNYIYFSQLSVFVLITHNAFFVVNLFNIQKFVFFPLQSALFCTVFVCGAGFVVHRGRTIPTLASMQEPLVPARLRQAKEKSNHDSKNDERGRKMNLF